MREAGDLIAWEPRRPYGPSQVRGRDADCLDRHYGLVAEKYSRQIDFVAGKLGDNSVRDLLPRMRLPPRYSRLFPPA